MNDVGGAGQLLDGLELKVDRAGTAEAVTRRIANGDYPAAFVAAMVWGHGSTGYGPYRTAWALTGSRTPRGRPVDAVVVERLQESARLVTTEGPVAAYRYLRNAGRIPGLGPAFFTKWMYFASADGQPYGPQAAPILDQLVSGWLGRHDVSLRYGSTADYGRYVDLLSAWGEISGRTPVEVEEAIFENARAVKRAPGG